MQSSDKTGLSLIRKNWMDHHSIVRSLPCANYAWKAASTHRFSTAPRLRMNNNWHISLVFLHLRKVLGYLIIQNHAFTLFPCVSVRPMFCPNVLCHHALWTPVYIVIWYWACENWFSYDTICYWWSRNLHTYKKGMQINAQNEHMFVRFY